MGEDGLVIKNDGKLPVLKNGATVCPISSYKHLAGHNFAAKLPNSEIALLRNNLLSSRVL
jgi:hypothetical protein